jgi:hypothetical protein
MPPARFAAVLAAALVASHWIAITSGSAQPGGEAPATPANADPGAEPSEPAAENEAASPAPADIPVDIRLRRLEQRVQALKERAWRAKARIGMLKEAVLGGGVGARASIVHENKMGNSYRLLKLQYALDGTTIFTRSDASGKLHDEKTFDVLTGPIAPGSHTLSVVAIYRGNGYGPIRYLNKYKFTVRSSHTFTASEGKGTSIRSVAFERGGASTPLEKRPAIDFKVTVSEAAKEK